MEGQNPRRGRRKQPRPRFKVSPSSRKRQKRQSAQAKPRRDTHVMRVDSAVFERIQQLKADRRCTVNEAMVVLLDRYDIHQAMSTPVQASSTPVRSHPPPTSVPVSTPEDDRSFVIESRTGLIAETPEVPHWKHVIPPVVSGSDDESSPPWIIKFPDVDDKLDETIPYGLQDTTDEDGGDTVEEEGGDIAEEEEGDTTHGKGGYIAALEGSDTADEEGGDTTDGEEGDTTDGEEGDTTDGEGGDTWSYTSEGSRADYSDDDDRSVIWTDSEVLADLDQSYVPSPPPSSDSDVEELQDYIRHVEFCLRPKKGEKDHFTYGDEVEEELNDREGQPTDEESTTIHSGDVFKPVGNVEEVLDTHTTIAYLDCLQLLADLPPISDCKIAGCTGKVGLQSKQVGTAMYLKWICDGERHHVNRRWCSQPRFKWGQHFGDFAMSCNILFTGNNYGKVSTLLSAMHMRPPHQTRYYEVHNNYAVPAVYQHWDTVRAGIITTVQQQDNVVILGDGRMDSPGFNAQYCTYTFMENESKDIVEVVVVDKREVDGKSTNMEKRGFLRGMENLKEAGVDVKEVVTDAHVQIKALIKTSYPEVHHSLDVWHGAKNLGKKLIAASSEKECGILLQWVSHLTNHFWHCVKESDTYDQFTARWRGMLYHVTGEHTWPLTDGYGTGKCEHTGLEAVSGDKDLLEKGSKALYKLRTIILDPNFLKKVEMYLRFRTTSELECFNNQILQFASKRFAFQYPGYKARCLLAAVAYQENKTQEVLTTSTGHLRLKRLYRKRSATWDVAYAKAKTFHYVRELMRLSLEDRLQHPNKGRQPRALDDPRRIAQTSGRTAPPESKAIHEAKRSRLTE